MLAPPMRWSLTVQTRAPPPLAPPMLVQAAYLAVQAAYLAPVRQWLHHLSPDPSAPHTLRRHPRALSKTAGDADGVVVLLDPHTAASASVANLPSTASRSELAANDNAADMAIESTPEQYPSSPRLVAARAAPVAAAVATESGRLLPLLRPPMPVIAASVGFPAPAADVLAHLVALPLLMMLACWQLRSDAGAGIAVDPPATAHTRPDLAPLLSNSAPPPVPNSTVSVADAASCPELGATIATSVAAPVAAAAFINDVGVAAPPMIRGRFGAVAANALAPIVDVVAAASEEADHPDAAGTVIFDPLSPMDTPSPPLSDSAALPAPDPVVPATGAVPRSELVHALVDHKR
ncbi:hypothetical protein HDU96_002185 [Phlyctochytrium bullatum]|nr:hypothetical protein HDU96_002185 [Phlyctochytrium bullatum]